MSTHRPSVFQTEKETKLPVATTPSMPLPPEERIAGAQRHWTLGKCALGEAHPTII